MFQDFLRVDYLVVKDDNEVEELFDFLEQAFTPESVYGAIRKGNLKIYSMEKLFHDF